MLYIFRRLAGIVETRGNKEGIKAEFTPPREKFAFPIVIEGEADLFEIWPEPLPIVIRALEKFVCYQEVAENLLDIELIKREPGH